MEANFTSYRKSCGGIANDGQLLRFRIAIVVTLKPSPHSTPVFRRTALPTPVFRRRIKKSKAQLGPAAAPKTPVPTCSQGRPLPPPGVCWDHPADPSPSHEVYRGAPPPPIFSQSTWDLPSSGGDAPCCSAITSLVGRALCSFQAPISFVSPLGACVQSLHGQRRRIDDAACTGSKATPQ